jgi:hypothetical protein
MNVWLLLGAGMVGFAAAWLVFELWRAWTPDAIRAQNAATPEVTRELEQLRRQVAELQREIDTLRGTARAPTVPPVPIDTYEPAAPIRAREVYDTRARQRVREQPQW